MCIILKNMNVLLYVMELVRCWGRECKTLWWGISLWTK